MITVKSHFTDLPVYFIFGAWDIVGFCVIYIFAVETKQVSPLSPF